MSYATTHIHKYSVDFYKTLEAETGLNAGFYVVGNLRMAQTERGWTNTCFIRRSPRLPASTTNS
jgi:hypothetical protein